MLKSISQVEGKEHIFERWSQKWSHPPPFPQRNAQHNQKQEEQLKSFLEMFKQLRINIPLADALK